ncbi:hypothetical protein D3C76_1305800 [compost metagenome]
MLPDDCWAECSVQLQSRLRTTAQAVAEHQQHSAEAPIQRHLVHAIERDVEHPRQPALQFDAAHQVAHEIADGAEARQRDQRAVVLIAILRQRLAF